MKEDSFLLGQIEDKLSQCANKYIVTNTGFLDSRQQSLARQYCRKNFVAVFEADEEDLESSALPPVRTVFYGGYGQAERVIMVNLPDYAMLGDQQLLSVIRAQITGGKDLTHRDYLGSLMGLGIRRECVGDILVREDGADLIVLTEIADYILTNYCKAGRTSLSLDLHPTSELLIPPVKRTRVTDTVASLRLDSVAASAFGISRGRAAEAIGKGLVFVNHIEINRVDYPVKEGDQITFRGKGKACLLEVGGRSRKDRQYITLERY